MASNITVVIPTIPERTAMLHRALKSVEGQALKPDALAIVYDNDHTGAPASRTRGLETVKTEWTAFLDDDDEFYAMHLRNLKMHQETHGADFVFSWFDVYGGRDPFPANEHKEFDPANPHQTTVTVLVRTSAALEVGGFMDEESLHPELDPGTDKDGNRSGEEFRFVIRLAQAGFKIVHLDQRTWRWNHHTGNTSGLPSRVRPADSTKLPSVENTRALGIATI